MRCERKAIFSMFAYHNIKPIILQLGFKPIYTPSTNYSIYYDTHEWALYSQSMNGLGAREKVRIRFYSEESRGVWLERKIRAGELGYKIRESLLPSDIGFNCEERSISIPRLINSRLMPRLFIRYNRENFTIPGWNLRISLDTSLRSSLLLTRKDLAESKRVSAHEWGILEIKFDQNNLRERELCTLILDRLESKWTKLTKNSKYCSCLERHIQ